ncbi:MAG: hypothetical protein IT383_19595 [Deltaproteobacteria bacterium]|nr:hypothetical protein [Deltaproteobacteria bacterium]
MAAHSEGRRIEVSGATTIPGASASAVGLAALHDDEAFHALCARVRDARATLPDWDNLAHVEAFAAAVEDAAPLFERFPAAPERRVLAQLLWQLLPAPQRARAFRPLPEEIARRAGDGFALMPGDVPRVAASWVSFLGDPELVARALAQAPTVLVPKSQAKPPHPRAPAALVQVERLEGATVHARAQDGGDEGVRPTALDTVTSWLLCAGPDARGLDLRSADDRALLLTWASLVRDAGVDGRSAFAWLQDGNAPPAIKARVVDACLDAAVTAVSSCALDPLACRFVLRAHEGDGAWPEQAAARLRAVLVPDGPLVREVAPRAPSTGSATELVWADAILTSTGFAAGRLSALGAGRAFARLATTMLAPLGVLPLSGLRDGQGAVVLQRFVEDAAGQVTLAPPRLVSFGATVTNEPLADAWCAGRGLNLPDPRSGPRHELGAMAAWLSLFFEGLDEGYRSRPPQPADPVGAP